MAEFILAFIFMLAAVAAMAIGVLNGRAPISGTCGGLNNMGEAGACEICGGDTSKCESNDQPTTNGRFYDAGESSAK